ncbi:MAG: hypothetical protein HOP15_17385, partial [Planctomycetes bacterium]|nr:hypothetical protein [Planctomycetota bacterium]
MKAHSTEHELWLADLLGGVRLASDPEVAKRLASCTRCRELLAELQPVAERLERAGKARAALLAELEDAVPAPGEEQIAVALERIAAREPHVRRISRGWVVAAAWLARAFLAGSPSEPLWL